MNGKFDVDILASDAFDACVNDIGRIDRKTQRGVLTEMVAAELEGDSLEEVVHIAAGQIAAKAITRQRRRQKYRVDQKKQMILWDDRSILTIGDDLDVLVDMATQDDVALAVAIHKASIDAFLKKWKVEKGLFDQIRKLYTEVGQVWHDLDLTGLAEKVVHEAYVAQAEGWDEDDPRWDASDD